MRWTVVIPGALLPSPVAADVIVGAATPWLASVLSRAQVEEDEPTPGGATHLAWLWRQFGGTGEPVTAPYALLALDAGANCRAQCWHIDPVHFVFARDHLLVTPLGEALSPEEAVPLAADVRDALRELAGSASPALHVHDDHWLLTLGRPWSIRASPLDAALGQPAHEHWGQGDDAPAWRRLLNEVQMRWHASAVNEARELRAAQPVNALWLHGGGAWSALPSRPFAAVFGGDPVLRGWALASGVARESLRDDPAPARGDAISIRRDLLAPAQFEAWGQWLERLERLERDLRDVHRACFAAGFDELVLALCGRSRVRIVRLRRSDSWRLWRRAPLAPLLAEAA